MNEYWGELESMVETDSGIIAVERAEITRRRPLKVESIHYNQTVDNNEDNDYMKTCVTDVPIGNPVMLHSIQLLQFIRILNDNKNTESITRESLPQLCPSNHQLIDKYSVQKINGKDMNEMAVKQLVRRALILIAVHYGYEITSESILDLLVDILCEYLLRMCQTIRSVSDSIALRSSNDFIDVIDRVFHEMNVPNFESLRQYEEDLRIYNQNLMKDALRKIGINESITSASKNNSSEFTLIPNNDKSPNLSVNTQLETNDFEPTISLKSILDFNKVCFIR
jgi:hypothetical protein